MKEKKNRKRFNNSRRSNSIKLVKIVSLLVVIGIIAFIGINKGINSFANMATSQNSDKKDVIENPSEDEKKEFGEVPLINDNRGVPVICFHSINDDPSVKSPIIISKDKFRTQLQAIKDNGYTTLTMAQLNDYLSKDKAIPEKSVVLTFDDGYRDNYTNVFPILKEFNMNATIFVIQSYLDRDGYLTTDQVKELSSSGIIDIESHTVSHIDLPTMSYEDQLKELKNSKEKLESLINKPIISIAYPEGKYNDDTKKAFSEVGYSMGFTTERGYADRDDNSAELNRICVDYTYKPKDILKVLKNLKK
ncbi:polysaccharide deacetylase [Clostridium sp. MF28]|uniref:polysaccharide deacetylase family protein n=1 Tax=Clostridium TaxID=1485 RepID=UPI0002E6C3B1|nr:MULTISPECIES: polysaccharide deacetylase family protein [Clostridium]AVK51319.1 polysaccharide deacetylase [Clostridium sp. MF28]PSM59325.1 polysaccharide deacetylase family protein [Clostridium diolis]